MKTIPVQVRLSTAIVEVIDQRASAAGISRAEYLRGVVEGALIGPQVADHDPLLVQMGDALGTLLARTDMLVEIIHSTRKQARAAYVTAYLHALTMLPAGEQEGFIAKVKGKLT